MLISEVGFGTADLEEKAEEAIFTAMTSGYRLIDTARAYGSEKAVGKALKRVCSEHKHKREDYLIQTKLKPGVVGYRSVLDDFSQSLEDLGTDYVDVYFLHWPVNRGSEKTYHAENIEIWRAFEELYKIGKVKRLGVCNFLERHLLDIFENCEVKPSIHQLEIHPGFQQIGLVEYSKKIGMDIEAWSPMGRGELNSESYIEMASKYSCNIGQLALKWSLQKGFVPLSRSRSQNHIVENRILDFHITDQDMDMIDALNTNTNHLDIWSYKRQQMY